MKHTKEPWEARRDPSYYGIVSEVYAGDKFILGTGGVHSPSELEANTKRIVACVNACAGITNAALEKGILDDAIALVLNSGEDIGVTWDGMAPYYEGVKVWEDV
jgi:regulator of RNase E activity RraB